MPINARISDQDLIATEEPSTDLEKAYKAEFERIKEEKEKLEGDLRRTKETSSNYIKSLQNTIKTLRAEVEVSSVIAMCCFYSMSNLTDIFVPLSYIRINLQLSRASHLRPHPSMQKIVLHQLRAIQHSFHCMRRSSALRISLKILLCPLTIN